LSPTALPLQTQPFYLHQMNRSRNTQSSSTRELPPYTVKNSAIHGNGVFARRKIAAGTRIIEYQGERISWKEALKREARKEADSTHTFLFSLDDGRVIDGGSQGNDARWINHACEPNCEAREEDGKVFIFALRDIQRGEELNYNYALILDERHTPAVKRAYACLCGAPSCRKTMLAPKRGKKIS
jgi:SET domain-containing protein